jgi:hypothetical protein
MSVRSDRSAQPDAVVAETSSELATFNLGGDHVNATIAAAQNADSALAPANSLSTNHPDHPLKRSIVVNIRASLSDLALRKTKGTWAPSHDALRSILQCALAPLQLARQSICILLPWLTTSCCNSQGQEVHGSLGQHRGQRRPQVDRPPLPHRLVGVLGLRCS